MHINDLPSQIYRRFRTLPAGGRAAADAGQSGSFLPKGIFATMRTLGGYEAWQYMDDLKLSIEKCKVVSHSTQFILHFAISNTHSSFLPSPQWPFSKRHLAKSATAPHLVEQPAVTGLSVFTPISCSLVDKSSVIFGRSSKPGLDEPSATNDGLLNAAGFV